MIKGVTTTGFVYEIEKDVLDDYEFLEVLHKTETGDTGCITEVIEILLGKEQAIKLKEHLRNERGRVPASKMMEEVSEILSNENLKK